MKLPFMIANKQPKKVLADKGGRCRKISGFCCDKNYKKKKKKKKKNHIVGCKAGIIYIYIYIYE